MDAACPVHDWLGSHRIPHISEQNSAEEAVCKLPPKLPDMSIFNIYEEYKLRPEEIDLQLIPQYIQLTRTTDSAFIEQNQTCATETDVKSDVFTWVSWYESAKAEEKGRDWIVEEKLLCQTTEADESQVKPPACVIPNASLVVPPPLTHFGNLSQESAAHKKNSYPELADLANQIDDLLDQMEDLLRDLMNPHNSFGFGAFQSDCNVLSKKLECDEIEQLPTDCAEGCWEEEREYKIDGKDHKNVPDDGKTYKVQICATELSANFCQKIYSHVCFLDIWCNWNKKQKSSSDAPDEWYYEDCAAHLVGDGRYYWINQEDPEKILCDTHCALYAVYYSESEENTVCTAYPDWCYKRTDDKPEDWDDKDYGVLHFNNNTTQTDLHWCGYTECDEC